VLGPADRQVRMIVSVVPDLVTLIDDSPNESRILFRVHATDEKGCFHPACFENVEHARSPFGIRSIIEGEGNLMLAAEALVIKSRELRETQIGRGKVSICRLLNPARAIRA